MRLITGPTWPPRPIDSILNAVLIKLTSSLASGIAGIDIYDQANNTWHGRMRVNEGIISGLTEVSIPSKFFQDPILSHGTLQRLKVRKHDLAIKNHTHALIKLNLGLQYLEFPAQEDQALWHLGFILKTRNKSAGQLRVILLEESNNTEICIANVEIGVQGANDEGKPVVIDVLEWTCSHIAGGAGDTDAAILDMITLRFPPTLTSLAFDISDLTDQVNSSIEDKTVIADRLKGHLPGSDLALSTSPSAMSYLTIASSQRQYRGTAESNAEQNNVFHTLAINGLDVLAELCPDYQTCLVESSSATNTRGQKIMESGALYPAMGASEKPGTMRPTISK
ncbi:hypothetical protein BG003_001073 [Podila horticola]|nr:hypothetical protein BG003_001073 [Podila horticola]